MCNGGSKVKCYRFHHDEVGEKHSSETAGRVPIIVDVVLGVVGYMTKAVDNWTREAGTQLSTSLTLRCSSDMQVSQGKTDDLAAAISGARHAHTGSLRAGAWLIRGALSSTVAMPLSQPGVRDGAVLLAPDCNEVPSVVSSLVIPCRCQRCCQSSRFEV